MSRAEYRKDISLLAKILNLCRRAARREFRGPLERLILDFAMMARDMEMLRDMLARQHASVSRAVASIYDYPLMMSFPDARIVYAGFSRRFHYSVTIILRPGPRRQPHACSH